MTGSGGVTNGQSINRLKQVKLKIIENMYRITD